jgi:hypothetical protein
MPKGVINFTFENFIEDLPENLTVEHQLFSIKSDYLSIIWPQKTDYISII